jgi:hypothetical protein
MTSTLDSRIDAIAADLNKLAGDASADEAARKKLLGILNKSTAQVELPVETIWRMMMSPHAPSALNVIIRTGVLEEIVKAGKPQSAKELGEKLKVDPELIVRMMRPQVALGIFKETGVQTYESTPISQTLTAPPLIGGYQFL